MTTTPEAPPAENRMASAPAEASPEPRRRLRKRLVIGGVALLVAAAVAVLAVVLLGGDDQTLKGTSGDTFHLAVPDGWRALSNEELTTLPGKPAAVVRRDDGKGFLVIRREGRPPKSMQDFAKQLDGEFQKRIPDFQKRTTRSLKIRAGDAFFYSYIRKRKGTVHSVVLVPGPKGSYVLNTVAAGGEDQVAKDLGRMIVSFND